MVYTVGTIVVICFVVLSAVALFRFTIGWKTGRAQIEREFAEEAMRKEADKKYYESEKAKINTPDTSVGVCCSHKVVAVGFNTLRYDASVGVLNPPHE